MIRFASLLFGIFLFPLALYGAGPGFSHGDYFEAHTLRGSITVNCPNLRANYSCQDYYLSPSMRDYFVYKNAPAADSVKLTATHQNRNTRSKTESFRNGQSTSSVNLWVATLFQRPLLGHGENRINYEMQRNGEVVEEGEFNVFVERKPTRYCPHRTYWSSSDFDCRGGGATICSRYFHEVRNCR